MTVVHLVRDALLLLCVMHYRYYMYAYRVYLVCVYIEEKMYVHVKEAEGVVATTKTGTLAMRVLSVMGFSYIACTTTSTLLSVVSLIIWISLLLLLCLIVMIDLFDLYVFAV